MTRRDLNSQNPKDVELTRLLRRATEESDTDLRHTIAYAARVVLDELPLTTDDIAQYLAMTRAEFDRQMLNLDTLSLERAETLAGLAQRHARTVGHRANAELLGVLADASLISKLARTAVLQYGLHGYGGGILAHVLAEIRNRTGAHPSLMRQRALTDLQRLLNDLRAPGTPL